MLQPAWEARPAGRNGTVGRRPGAMVRKRGHGNPPPVPTSCSLPTIAGFRDDKGRQREIVFREDQYDDVVELLNKEDWKGLEKYPDSGNPVPGSPEYEREERERMVRAEKEWKEDEEAEKAEKAAAQKVAKL
ncbi:uncharacterized protein MYCFIDRAFT_210214 [Pseudocercospora fijiensis CIRAD86]|uniref:Uncharacterized protein n=1 Tax=Pseudocercospora fijiensis (strain CIRAD86) TaxID=383855 RepID=M2Z6H8_PSEFD|nr:uncharacterized protein MYCFIDRAFT_210214 [Pseudocercospora fijiensis CIRAD86]EME85375.1 hypothetical protein MYCFIDRAFT_210214 [Pseudocercospora fijiensis CIRAD86]